MSPKLLDATSVAKYEKTDPIPLVIVEGFLGVGGPLLWGNFEQHSNSDVAFNPKSPRRRVIFTR
jgi:hypothetical protein